MLGWRGASRYYDPKFQPAFELELLALKKVREKFGLKNVYAIFLSVGLLKKLRK